MRKIFKFFFLIIIILLFFTTCDTPLKGYIEYATSRAAADGWVFNTDFHPMEDEGEIVYAIPPSDERGSTEIILSLDNPQNGSIELEIEGDGSEHADYKIINNNQQASITINNQKSGTPFNLSVNIYINGRRMGEQIKLPKMVNKYFNNELFSLNVTTALGNFSYDVFNILNDFWFELNPGAENIKILVDKHQSSKHTINGETGNIIYITDNVTPLSIDVEAECGLTKTYTLIVYKSGFEPVITVTSNGKTTNHSTLQSAYNSIKDSDKNVEIKVYKDILEIEYNDLFNLPSQATKKEISILSDKNFIISLGSNGSMFTINKNIIFKVGGGKGTLALQGNSFNDSPLINVNGGIFELYDRAEIYNNAYTGGTGYGGGVSVTNGTFNMYGGSIKNNTTAFGGGVYVTNGTFNMNGGSIEGNYSISSSAASYGGGVYITDKSTFNMKGGSIKGNKAISYFSNSYGGGVSITNGSTFNMDGGIVGGYYWDDYLLSKEPNYAMYGGGVYVKNSTFNFKNGLIGNPNAEKKPLNLEMADNYASGDGGGVYIDNGTFNYYNDGWNKYKGLIMGNWADGNGGGVYIGSGVYSGPPDEDIDKYYKFNHPYDIGHN